MIGVSSSLSVKTRYLPPVDGLDTAASDPPDQFSRRRHVDNDAASRFMAVMVSADQRRAQGTGRTFDRLWLNGHGQL